MKRLSIVISLFLCANILIAGSDVKYEALPNWVNQIELSNQKIIENNGSYQYLLIDLQDNVRSKEVFRHYAVKVLNSDGIQEMSTITINFDPSYQTLTIHKIQIRRNGSNLDRLDKDQLSIIQRETDLERSLYDGSLSAVIVLSDVEENDIIEYSYSINGFNPVNKGSYTGTFYHDYSIPVNRIYNRVISGESLEYFLKNDALEPTIVTSNLGIEYVWDVSALKPILYDSNIPSWYNAQKSVNLSSFKNWLEVTNWALPLYDYKKETISSISDEITTGNTIGEKIINSIRFVQDEVRYVGFESGIGAYKPNPPKKVFEQRYGDCKDKSLLLIALLRHQGLEANPVLVNTNLGHTTDEWLPSDRLFDHCVVTFSYNDEEYYVDPTLSNQGGSLNNIHFPDYEMGLIVRPGEDKLSSIASKNIPKVDIKEIITVKEIGGDAEFLVRSEYTGKRADNMRTTFQTNSLEALEKDYLNYYSNLYPDIEILENLKYYDYNRNSNNNFIVEESYLIKNFWVDSDDKTYIYAETYPMVLESSIDFKNTAQNKMPYYLGRPFQFEQNTQVILPEPWNFSDYSKKIEGNGFVYENKIFGAENTLYVNHKYEIKKSFIEGSQVSDFQKKHDEIEGELSYYLTYNQDLSGFKLSWISIAIAVVTIIGGLFLAYKINYLYNPDPWEHSQNKQIGGWLILPAIGLIISPFVLSLQIINEDFFNHNTWLSLNSIGENAANITVLFAAELIYNFLFLMFNLLVIYMFFSRRTSLPRLITIYYIVSLLGPILDHFLVEILAPGVLTEVDRNTTYTDATRTIIGAAIWIPYFNISERSKNTFCRKL